MLVFWEEEFKYSLVKSYGAGGEHKALDSPIRKP